jgi:hypothetical protein
MYQHYKGHVEKEKKQEAFKKLKGKRQIGSTLLKQSMTEKRRIYMANRIRMENDHEDKAPATSWQLFGNTKGQKIIMPFTESEFAHKDKFTSKSKRHRSTRASEEDKEEEQNDIQYLGDDDSEPHQRPKRKSSKQSDNIESTTPTDRPSSKEKGSKN